MSKSLKEISSLATVHIDRKTYIPSVTPDDLAIIKDELHSWLHDKENFPGKYPDNRQVRELGEWEIFKLWTYLILSKLRKKPEYTKLEEAFANLTVSKRKYFSLKSPYRIKENV